MGDEGNDCLLSVDGTDFLSPQYGKKWYSHKFKHSGLRYEVALCTKLDGFVGLVGHGTLGVGMILKFFAPLS